MQRKKANKHAHQNEKRANESAECREGWQAIVHIKKKSVPMNLLNIKQNG